MWYLSVIIQGTRPFRHTFVAVTLFPHAARSCMLCHAMHDEQPSTVGPLAARAHDLLSAAGHPLSAETLIEHVFGVRQSGTRVNGGGMHGLLARVLKESSIFSQNSDGTWGLVAWGSEDVPLDQMEYVVVDCETTGLNPQTQRVLEIAALRCRGPQVVARFTT